MTRPRESDKLRPKSTSDCAKISTRELLARVQAFAGRKEAFVAAVRKDKT